MHLGVRLVGVLAVCLPLHVADARACAVDGAVYTPVSPDADEVRYAAVFSTARPALANQAPFVLRMRNGRKGGEHAFMFAKPNGYGQTLIMVQPEAGTAPGARGNGADDEDISASALFFDKALRSIDPLFDPAPQAPPFMLFSDLGKAFWYGAPDRSFIPPRGMWRRVSCER